MYNSFNIVINEKTNKEMIFDASYDIYSLKNKSYFYNIKDFIENFKGKKVYLDEQVFGPVFNTYNSNL